MFISKKELNFYFVRCPNARGKETNFCLTLNSDSVDIKKQFQWNRRSASSYALRRRVSKNKLKKYFRFRGFKCDNSLLLLLML